MLEQSLVKPIVRLDDQRYIVLVPDAAYNLEVWEEPESAAPHRMGRMDYKYHRDTFAGFIYRLIPGINFVQIHDLQKQINPYFDLEV